MIQTPQWKLFHQDWHNLFELCLCMLPFHLRIRLKPVFLECKLLIRRTVITHNFEFKIMLHSTISLTLKCLMTNDMNMNKLKMVCTAYYVPMLMNYSLAVLLGSLYSPFTGGDLQVELLSKSEKWSPWSEKSGAVLNFFCKFSKSFWKIKEMTDHKNKEISEIEMFKIKYVYKYTIFSLPITMPIYVYVCICTILLPWLFQFVSSNSLLVHHRLFDADEVSKRKTIFFIQHLTFSQ